jgi:L-aspartate oxidase
LTNTKSVPAETDFVVVGAGIAGLRAAVELASAGRVLVLAKLAYTESATQYAQGGIAAALSDEDEISLHFQDTINAGDGIVNPDAAHVLVEEGPERIEELIAWGTHFDRNGSKLAFTREGAHSRDRILHAQGDSTGREIGRALFLKAQSLKNISICEFEFATSLIVQDGRVVGLNLLGPNGAMHAVRAAAVLFATGGIGHVFRETTNPDVATGDGIAIAYRAGAELSDMEFVQFHPTALYVKGAPRFLLSEALRGEGAILRNDQLARFMPKYHALAELAPRDVVARAIAHELELSRSKDPVVYLDLTHKNAERLQHRFPRIYQTCLKYNVDITTDMIPARPAVHYAMGGVRTDLYGRTSVPGLYAAGEVACTGVHGANRLASNSLLEGLVYGARAARTMRQEAKLPNHKGEAPKAATQESAAPAPQAAEEVIRQIQDIMWRDVGIVRSRETLQRAITQLEGLKPSLPHRACRRCCEASNIWQTGILIAKSALARLESRGAHYRLDYPAHDDAKFKKHSIIATDRIRFD